MLQKKISFHNMEHSAPLEKHANQKLDKVLDVLREETNPPFFAEMWIKANRQHPHHSVEIHLKTPTMNLHAQDENPDMYIAVDSAVDKMVSLIKKEKERRREDRRHPDTDKSKFSR